MPEAPGVALQAATQVSLVLLLFGTVIGDFALLADVGQRALRRLSLAPLPLLVDHDGRGIMLLLALCVVLPLCLLRRWGAPACPHPFHGHACAPMMLTEHGFCAACKNIWHGGRLQAAA